MYDALIEDEDSTRTRASKGDFASVVEAGSHTPPAAATDELDLGRRSPKTGAEELRSGMDETDAWSDDPVRMYLTQMGEIPLLTREEEIFLAKQIEVTRRRFRRALLSSDFALNFSFETLNQVSQGELPFDRTIKVSMTESLEKDQILGRMPHNLATVASIRERDLTDFAMARSIGLDSEQGLKIRETINERRRRSITLLEEMSLRTQRLQPCMKRLQQVSVRMLELEEQIANLKDLSSAEDECRHMQKELDDLIGLTLESPRSLADKICLLYTSPSPRDQRGSRMPSSA